MKSTVSQTKFTRSLLSTMVLSSVLTLSILPSLCSAKAHNANMDAHSMAIANSAENGDQVQSLVDHSSTKRVIRRSTNQTNSVAATSNQSISNAAAPSSSVQQRIRQTLQQAGIKPKITSIKPSQLPNMYQVTLEGQPPLHITGDGQYVLQGELQPNPSPKVSTPPADAIQQAKTGAPVSPALRQSMLKNMSLLKNMTAETPLYHTAVPGVIWGMTFEGQPFITNAEGSVFTDGEVSVIKDGQFAGLDIEFEQNKNRYIFSQLDEKQLIIYPATGKEKAVVYVATDVNCPYCRQLHSHIPELNAKGITLKVIGYPIYDESPEQMRQIWCETSANARRKALDSAMKGQVVPSNCNGSKATVNNLEANQLKASGLAVFATPAIFSDNGLLYQGSFESPEFMEFLGIQ